MIDAIKEVSCTRCLHQEVCKYKQDFLDICNKIKTTPITNLDCLGGIQIECRYYQMQAINPRLFGPGIIYHGDPITNPYTKVTNPSTLSTLSNTPNPYLITATNAEDNKTGGDVR